MEEDALHIALKLSVGDEKLKGKGESRLSSEPRMNDLLRPDLMKIIACAMFTAFVTFEVALRTK
jgi:hypothetical protein